MSYYGNLYQNEELSHRAKTVYMYLHDRSDAAGACWPGVKRIASDLKLSRRQSRYRPNGSLTSNLYQITTRKEKSSQPPAKGGL